MTLRDLDDRGLGLGRRDPDRVLDGLVHGRLCRLDVSLGFGTEMPPLERARRVHDRRSHDRRALATTVAAGAATTVGVGDGVEAAATTPCTTVVIGAIATRDDW